MTTSQQLHKSKTHKPGNDPACPVCVRHTQLADTLEAIHARQESRFFEISRFESDSEICLRQVTEEQISRSVDMADCEPDYVMLKRFYVDDAGEIQPVTIGRQRRFHDGVEQPFHFAASSIVAGGKVVGEVVYTDH